MRPKLFTSPVVELCQTALMSHWPIGFRREPVRLYPVLCSQSSELQQHWYCQILNESEHLASLDHTDAYPLVALQYMLSNGVRWSNVLL